MILKQTILFTNNLFTEYNYYIIYVFIMRMKIAMEELRMVFYATNIMFNKQKCKKSIDFY